MTIKNPRSCVFSPSINWQPVCDIFSIPWTSHIKFHFCSLQVRLGSGVTRKSAAKGEFYNAAPSLANKIFYVSAPLVKFLQEKKKKKTDFLLKKMHPKKWFAARDGMLFLFVWVYVFNLKKLLIFSHFSHVSPIQHGFSSKNGGNPPSLAALNL